LCPDRFRFAEARGDVDGGAIGQRHHGADTGGRHQAPAHRIVSDDGQQTAMQDEARWTIRQKMTWPANGDAG